MRAARLFVTALFCWVLSSCGGGSSVALNTGGGVGTGGRFQASCRIYFGLSGCFS